MLQPEASKPFRTPRAVPTDVEDQDQSSKDIRRQGSGEREREREREREGRFGSSREWFKGAEADLSPPLLFPSLRFATGLSSPQPGGLLIPPRSAARLLDIEGENFAHFTVRVRDSEIGEVGPVRGPSPRRAGELRYNYPTVIGDTLPGRRGGCEPALCEGVVKIANVVQRDTTSTT